MASLLSKQGKNILKSYDIDFFFFFKEKEERIEEDS